MIANFKNKNVLITAGATFENIDPVRFIGNRSSGKMGIAIANAFVENKANVTLIKANTEAGIFIDEHIQIIKRETAEEILNSCLELFSSMDIIVMVAAISDYIPVKASSTKIKKSENVFILELKKTKDILFELGKLKQPHQYLIGFSLETDNDENNALLKMKNKNCDMMILNSLNDANKPFGSDKNTIHIFTKNNSHFYYNNKTKDELSHMILEKIYT